MKPAFYWAALPLAACLHSPIAAAREVCGLDVKIETRSISGSANKPPKKSYDNTCPPNYYSQEVEEVHFNQSESTTYSSREGQPGWTKVVQNCFGTASKSEWKRDVTLTKTSVLNGSFGWTDASNYSGTETWTGVNSDLCEWDNTGVYGKQIKFSETSVYTLQIVNATQWPAQYIGSYEFTWVKDYQNNSYDEGGTNTLSYTPRLFAMADPWLGAGTVTVTEKTWKNDVAVGFYKKTLSKLFTNEDLRKLAIAQAGSFPADLQQGWGGGEAEAKYVMFQGHGGATIQRTQCRFVVPETAKNTQYKIVYFVEVTDASGRTLPSMEKQVIFTGDGNAMKIPTSPAALEPEPYQGIACVNGVAPGGTTYTRIVRPRLQVLKQP